MNNFSEVAQLRQQIEHELEAMRLGVVGFAVGTARHRFIQARMQRVGCYQEQLALLVGDAGANQTVCQLYVEVMEQER